MKGVKPLTKNEEKEMLCQKFQALLALILQYGSGAMLLPQLRALCAVLLDMNGQTVNRAVRALKAAEILTRQTWVDNNSDLILARKYAYRFFEGKTSQEIATTRRPHTMAPYLLGARKIDWLLSFIEKNGITSAADLEYHLSAIGCTMFLRLPDLLGYYQEQAPILSYVRPDNYCQQERRLELSDIQRRTMAQGNAPAEEYAPPITTLEQLHRRGIYIYFLSEKKKQVGFVLFAGRETKARRLMDWLIDAHFWVTSLLPEYETGLWVYALDWDHKAALMNAFTAIAPGTSKTMYYRYRLEGAKIYGRANIGVVDSDFITKWCGNVSALTN